MREGRAGKASAGRGKFHPIEYSSPTTLPVLGLTRGRKKQEMFLKDGAIDQVPRPPMLAHVKDAYALYVADKAMSPMYRPRQLLFINPHKPPAPGHGVVIILNGGTVLIREFVRQKANSLVVRTHHPRQRIATLALASIAAIHAIAGALEPG